MSKIAFERAFQELTEEESEAVMNKSRRLVFPAETVIMREGEPQTRIYVILEGEINVIRLGHKGQETQLAEPLGPGDTVGEMSFIDDLGASATLVARTDVVVKVIDRDMIADMMEADDTFAGRFHHSLLYTVIRRLRVLDYKMAFPD